MSAAFFCVSGPDYFPGAVALLNSLRLTGHSEPLTVLDCGLHDDQRELLARHAEIVAAPDGAPPSMQKLVAPLASGADVVVLLDADIIVTRNLGELIDRAAAGDLVGFRNESERFFAEWGELGGGAPLRRGPYLSSSALIMDARTAAELLPAVQAEQKRLDRERTWLGGGDQADPFFYADQDLINALVLARIPAERVVALDTRLAAIPPFDGLKLRDERALRCEYGDGSRPYLLHHYYRKPWLVPMRANVYSRLLTRVLLDPDVGLRLDPRLLPLRLRRGPGAALARTTADVAIGIPAALRRRFAGGPETISAWPDTRAGQPPG